MDPRKLEYYEYEFLDLTDIDENERKHLKHTLFSSQGTPDFLQLPWTNRNIVEEEWSKEPDQYDEPQHVPNGPLDVPGSVSPSMVVPPQTTISPVVQHMPAVTMYSQHAPPPYTMPPSTGYQHPQNVFVSNVSNMHTYMTGHYVQPHYAPMPPEPQEMTVGGGGGGGIGVNVGGGGGRGHRGRSRGRGNKRNDARGGMDNTIVETSNAPAFNQHQHQHQHQHQQFVPIHAYHPAAAYYPQTVGSHMPHPSAQHATGSPLYITPMYPPPMYSTYPHPSAQYFPPPNAVVTPVMEEQQQQQQPQQQQPPPPPPEIQEMQEIEHHDQHMYPPQLVQEGGDPHYMHNNDDESCQNTSTVIVNSNMDQQFSNCNVKPDDSSSMYSVNNVITGKTETEAAVVHDFNENVKLEMQMPCVVMENIKTESPVVTVVHKVEPIVVAEQPQPNVVFSADVEVERSKADADDVVVVTVPTRVVVDKPSPSVNVNVNSNVIVDSDVNTVKPVAVVHGSVNKRASPVMPEPKPVEQTFGSLCVGEREHEREREREQEQTHHQHQQDLLPAQTSSAGKSWASLFNKGGGGSSPAAVNASAPLNNINTKTVHFKAQTSNSAFPKIYDEKQTDKANNETTNIKSRSTSQMGEFISKYALDFRTVSLQPRGLTNRSNYCYINSILQALLACPPLYNLLVALPHHRPRRKSNVKTTTPILDAMIDFVNEFTPLSAEARLNRKEKGQRKDNIDIICGTSFEPSGIYKILNGIRTDTFIVEGRQEDAEEFFGCILNGLNDEMLELTKQFEENKHQNLSNGDIATNGETHDQDEVEWTVMGPKNKGSITRRAEFGRTPVSDIFRGQLRSRVHRMGDQITDNVQPFFTLQLDIEKPNTVYEALEQLVNKDKLEGVTCWKTNKQVEAWQQVTIEELPAVLVLHLKCFNYKLDTCSKIIKALEFPIDLKIDSKLLSIKAKYTSKQKQYKLFAVVYHDGKEASKGHYLTDAYHVGYGGWVRYDDSTVKSVQESQVLHPGGARVPYLLYYRRNDTIGNQTQQNPKKD